MLFYLFPLADQPRMDLHGVTKTVSRELSSIRMRVSAEMAKRQPILQDCLLSSSITCQTMAPLCWKDSATDRFCEQFDRSFFLLLNESMAAREKVQWDTLISLYLRFDFNLQNFWLVSIAVVVLWLATRSLRYSCLVLVAIVTNFSDLWAAFSALMTLEIRKSAKSLDLGKVAFSGRGGPKMGTSLDRVTDTL